MSNQFSMPDGVSSSGQSKNRATDLNWNPIGSEAQGHRDSHSKSDVDSGPDALHHTLGRGPFQALPGSLIETIAPIGEIRMWPLAKPPKSFLICKGQAVSRADYQELFDAIGTAFGAGDGSTTFNLPDFRDRVVIGSSNLAGLSSNDGLDYTSRPAKLKLEHHHKLTIADETVTQNPHAHSVPSSGSHTHTTSYNSSGSHAHSISAAGSVEVQAGTGTTVANAGHAHGGSTGNSSGDHDHSIASSGDHIHNTDNATATNNMHHHPDSSVGDPKPPFTPDDTAWGFTGFPPFPFQRIVFIIRYSNLLNFEGASLT